MVQFLIRLNHSHRLSKIVHGLGDIMTQTTKQDYIQFPSEWEPIESKHVGPFVTRITHRRPDGTTDVRTSRRHRKLFGPEGEVEGKQRTPLFIWRPRVLNWWIAVLFMIGSWHFFFASALLLANNPDSFLIDLIYFTGSIFFTTAGYSTYYQSINAPEALDSKGQTTVTKKKRYFGWQPQRIDFWATFPLFIGTLCFNVMTFMAFFSFQWMAYDIFGWIPNFVGSILFLVAGTFGVLEFCHHFWCWQFKNVTWWIVVSNFLGCVCFMISAFAAFSRPNPIGNNLFFWATFTTLVGAFCFFVSSYLMWPEMAAAEQTENK